MHWIRIEFLRDMYLFNCEYENTPPSLTGFIQSVRKYIKFIIYDLRAKGITIITKNTVYKFVDYER